MNTKLTHLILLVIAASFVFTARLIAADNNAVVIAAIKLCANRSKPPKHGRDKQLALDIISAGARPLSDDPNDIQAYANISSGSALFNPIIRSNPELLGSLSAGGMQKSTHQQIVKWMITGVPKKAFTMFLWLNRNKTSALELSKGITGEKCIFSGVPIELLKSAVSLSSSQKLGTMNIVNTYLNGTIKDGFFGHKSSFYGVILENEFATREGIPATHFEIKY